MDACLPWHKGFMVYVSAKCKHGTDQHPAAAFEEVGFWYQEGEEVLRDFCLEVEAGQTVALVGATGSGKSTIVSLLSRFYEPRQGRITINGVDYRERSLRWLQSRLGIVLQTPHLFSGTILENIRYGRLSASDAEVMAAARAVFDRSASVTGWLMKDDEQQAGVMP